MSNSHRDLIEALDFSEPTEKEEAGSLRDFGKLAG